MARRHVRRANPPRWSREGRLLRKKLSRGVEQSAPEAAPVVAAPVTDVPSVVEVQEDNTVEASQESTPAVPAKKPARRRRRRSKSTLDEK